MSTATETASVTEAKPAKAKTTKPKAPKAPDTAKLRTTAELLKQVSEATRLQVILTLSDGERHVGDIRRSILGQSQSTVSHHLALMRYARIILPTRRGKNQFYSLTDKGQRLAAVVKTLV